MRLAAFAAKANVIFVYEIDNYAYTQIQDVVFPVDCTQADVDNAMIQLGEIINKNQSMRDAIAKLKAEILKEAKTSKKKTVA